LREHFGIQSVTKVERHVKSSQTEQHFVVVKLCCSQFTQSINYIMSETKKPVLNSIKAKAMPLKAGDTTSFTGQQCVQR